MKKLNLILQITVLLFAANLSAQNQELLHKYHLVKGDAIRVSINEDLNVTGSPYYNNDFQPANVHFPKASPILTMVRYDMEKEEMQVLMDKENYQVLENNVEVELFNKRFRKFDFIGENREINNGYFEVLKPGESESGLLVLRKHSKEIRTNAHSQARGFPAKYVDKSEHYLKPSNGHAVVVQPRLSNFLNVFPIETRDAMESYIKKKKLNHKKEEDLIAIVAYYNSTF